MTDICLSVCLSVFSSCKAKFVTFDITCKLSVKSFFGVCVSMCVCSDEYSCQITLSVTNYFTFTYWYLYICTAGLEWNILLRKAENPKEWRKLVIKSTVVPQQSARQQDR